MDPSKVRNLVSHIMCTRIDWFWLLKELELFHFKDVRWTIPSMPNFFNAIKIVFSEINFLFNSLYDQATNLHSKSFNLGPYLKLTDAKVLINFLTNTKIFALNFRDIRNDQLISFTKFLLLLPPRSKVKFQPSICKLTIIDPVV